jgi:hypothetical protein
MLFVLAALLTAERYLIVAGSSMFTYFTSCFFGVFAESNHHNFFLAAHLARVFHKSKACTAQQDNAGHQEIE